MIFLILTPSLPLLPCSTYPKRGAVVKKMFFRSAGCGRAGRIAGGSLKIAPNSDREFQREETQLENNIIKNLSLRKLKQFYHLIH
jgi:hypothetical protein